MKTLITTLSILTFSATIGSFSPTLVINSQKTNTNDNNHHYQKEQDTIYIDSDGNEVATSSRNLLLIPSKKVVQIGFYENEQGEIQGVHMPMAIQEVPTELPSAITSLEKMFAGCFRFNQDLSKWDTSNVTNMNSMFCGATVFNQDLSKWDVSNVIDMHSMFSFTKSFNQDLASWNVSSIVKHFDFAAGSGIKNANKLPKFNK